MKTYLGILLFLLAAVQGFGIEQQSIRGMLHNLKPVVDAGDRGMNNYTEMLLEILRVHADDFVSSEVDCRTVPGGPSVSLEPASSCIFTSPNGEKLAVELYIFSDNYSVLQVTTFGKRVEYFKWSKINAVKASPKTSEPKTNPKETNTAVQNNGKRG